LGANVLTAELNGFTSFVGGTVAVGDETGINGVAEVAGSIDEVEFCGKVFVGDATAVCDVTRDVGDDISLLGIDAGGLLENEEEVTTDGAAKEVAIEDVNDFVIIAGGDVCDDEDCDPIILDVRIGEE
jgi:hypothetical protein